MIEQILLGNSSLAGVREIGGFGQPLHLLYPQIRAVLINELGPEAATILAEPVVDRVGNRIDWYTQGDPDYPPSPLSALPDDQRLVVRSQIDDFLRRGCNLAERYTASADPRRVQLGALLQAVLHPPAESDVFLVHNQPVIIGWAFALDRPWDMAANPVRGPGPASPVNQLAAAPHDVVIPDMAIPELTSAAAPESASLPGAEPASSAPPELPPPLEPITPSATPLPLPLPSQSLIPNGIPVDQAPESVAAQQDEGGKSSPWLWWLIALIVLLLLFAAYWWMQDRSPPPVVAVTPGVLPVVEPERTATQQAQLGTVPPPAVDSSAQIAPRLASPGSASAVAVKPAVPMDAMPPPRPDGISPLLVNPAPVSEAGSKQAVAMPTATGERRVESALSADDTAGKSNAAAKPLPVEPLSPTRASSTATAPSAAEPSLAQALGGRDSMPPAASKSPLPPIKAEPVAATAPAVAAEPSLEQALSERESKLPAASKSPLSPIAPPIKAEPTSEERREFASRMSATGAVTGEITATLLWNSPGDLDLLVRCPSGQQLDYRSPAECGGALDVDANAARVSLSARPMENAFWPSGKAAPGNYEIAVRYAPRKDEQNPQETRFQVRLVRDGQESVFKGVVQPNTVTSVTTFTVER